jgi:hypothetical protein
MAVPSRHRREGGTYRNQLGRMDVPILQVGGKEVPTAGS